MKFQIVKSKVFSSKLVQDIEVEGRLLDFKEGVGLFNAKRKWWLRYSENHLTGSFESKKAAISWYENGGR